VISQAACGGGDEVPVENQIPPFYVDSPSEDKLDFIMLAG